MDQGTTCEHDFYAPTGNCMQCGDHYKTVLDAAREQARLFDKFRTAVSALLGVSGPDDGHVALVQIAGLVEQARQAEAERSRLEAIVIEQQGTMAALELRNTKLGETNAKLNKRANEADLLRAALARVEAKQSNTQAWEHGAELPSAAVVPPAPLSRLDRRDPRVNVLRLLADGKISVGKACEALTEIAAGGTPILPQPIDPDRYDDAVSWKERLARAEAALREFARPENWASVMVRDEGGNHDVWAWDNYQTPYEFAAAALAARPAQETDDDGPPLTPRGSFTVQAVPGTLPPLTWDDEGTAPQETEE